LPKYILYPRSYSFPEVNNIPCWPQLTQINLSSHHDILSIFPSPKVRCSPSKKDPFARLSKLIWNPTLSAFLFTTSPKACYTFLCVLLDPRGFYMHKMYKMYVYSSTLFSFLPNLFTWGCITLISWSCVASVAVNWLLTTRCPLQRKGISSWRRTRRRNRSCKILG